MDMQPYFAEREGYEKIERNQVKLESVLSRQIELIRIAKANQVPILVMEIVDRGRTNNRLLEEIGDYDLVEVFVKASSGMFAEYGGVADKIEAYLHSFGISELIMTGANGGACVRCSIVEALNKGYRVWADQKAIIDLNTFYFVLPYRYGKGDFVLPYRYDKGDLTLDAPVLRANFRQSEDLNEFNSLMTQDVSLELPPPVTTQSNRCAVYLQRKLLPAFRSLFSGWRQALSGG